MRIPMYLCTMYSCFLQINYLYLYLLGVENSAHECMYMLPESRQRVEGRAVGLQPRQARRRVAVRSTRHARACAVREHEPCWRLHQKHGPVLLPLTTCTDNTTRQKTEHFLTLNNIWAGSGGNGRIIWNPFGLDPMDFKV